MTTIGQLIHYEADADAYLKQRCAAFGRDPAGHSIVPCTVTIKI